MKYTVELPDFGTLNQMFLDNIKTQKLFLKEKNVRHKRFKRPFKIPKIYIK